MSVIFSTQPKQDPDLVLPLSNAFANPFNHKEALLTLAGKFRESGKPPKGENRRVCTETTETPCWRQSVAAPPMLHNYGKAQPEPLQISAPIFLSRQNLPQ